MRNILSTLLIYILLTGCNYDAYDNRYIYIQNDSKEDIYTIISSNDSIKTLNLYAGFPTNMNNYKYTFQYIEPDSVSTSNDKPRFWDDFTKKSKNGKIILFIIEKNLVDKNGWDTILSKNIYTRKYEFTIDDLDKVDWKVKYSN
jgi:hypothetical protein